jgi:DNA-binding response OmpR family regulator
VPVLFLTARTAEADVVHGLRSGADDYLVKPPSRAELLARIGRSCAGQRRSTRRDPKSSPTRSTPSAGASRWRGRVRLTDREFDLAAFLFRRHGRVVAVTPCCLSLEPGRRRRYPRSTPMSRLRKKLDLDGTHGWQLTAVYQRYRLERRWTCSAALLARAHRTPGRRPSRAAGRRG